MSLVLQVQGVELICVSKFTGYGRNAGHAGYAYYEGDYGRNADHADNADNADYAGHAGYGWDYGWYASVFKLLSSVSSVCQSV